MLTLQSRASWRTLSNSRRTNCSGRGKGARNLGLRTILGEPPSGSLEAPITIPFVQRVFQDCARLLLGLCGTATRHDAVRSGPHSAFGLMTLDYLDRPNARSRSLFRSQPEPEEFR